jgi:regulator of protease activity HflC (stomatin/prohibitin superfamily)
VVLAAEADKAQQVLRAEGEALAITAVAEAQAAALHKIGEAAITEGGQKAIQLELATKAIAAKHAIAKESTVVLLPDNATDASSVVAQAMTIINQLNSSTQTSPGSMPSAGQTADNNRLDNRNRLNNSIRGNNNDLADR